MAQLRYINQYSDDSERLIEFYEKVIGLRAESPNGSWYGFAASNTAFAIEPEVNRENNKTKYKANWDNKYLLQIGVADEAEMREILGRAKQAETPVLTEFERFEWGTVSKLVDPDGHLIELIY